MPEKASVAADLQKQRLLPLAANDKAYTGLAARNALPAGIASGVYAEHVAVPVNNGKKTTFGAACPALAPRAEWISASRGSYNQAWRNGRNTMFDAAAKALMASEPVGGPACS
jgi:hypothetical protein